MTTEQTNEISVLNRYISVMTGYRKSAKAMIDQLEQMKKPSDELKEKLDEYRSDLKEIDDALNIWEAREQVIIEEALGKQFHLPSFR